MIESASLRQRGNVIGVPIDVISWPLALGTLQRWALAHESRYVCICNVHSVVTATQDDAFRRIIEGADMATPDGAPVAWTLRRKGFAGQERINGPDLMWQLCAGAQAAGVRIGLFGSRQETLDLLSGRLLQAFPVLQIAYSLSPPFRAMTEAEDAAIVEAINACGVGLLFVGLGCPKQETWIAEHRERVQAVMLGVGAAFDYHAGTLSRAPAWMRSSGLEWLYRVLAEPRRLWKRYLVTNLLFLSATAREILWRRPSSPLPAAPAAKRDPGNG